MSCRAKRRDRSAAILFSAGQRSARAFSFQGTAGSQIQIQTSAGRTHRGHWSAHNHGARQDPPGARPPHRWPGPILAAKVAAAHPGWLWAHRGECPAEWGPLRSPGPAAGRPGSSAGIRLCRKRGVAVWAWPDYNHASR